MNFIDRAVAFISPSSALKRVQARKGLALITDRESAYQVSRTGARAGDSAPSTLTNWAPTKVLKWQQQRERETLTSRAQDLVANDSHAASVVDSLSLNIIGVGLRPQSRPHDLLGLTEDQTRVVQKAMEWTHTKWSKRAGVDQKSTFTDIQFQAIYSMLMAGEFICLPVIDRRRRDFLFSLQMIEPTRLRTPADLSMREDIRDGVQLDSHGAPVGYWIAEPDDGDLLRPSLVSSDFRFIRAKRGWRPNIFHEFFKKDPEQIRGVSILAPALKAFRDLSDYLDFELLGAIVAASFPVFVETPTPTDIVDAMPEDSIGQKYNEYAPGQVFYGSYGERPHVLESKRPAESFDVFVQTILRAIGASCGLPYEVVAKDFSKTNYSSARAALLEAWRVYTLYRQWMVHHFCQPVWEMVQEEAFLRGEVQLPEGAPSFYDQREAWCQASWIGPARGHVDPLKEAQAQELRLSQNLTTLSAEVAEQGEDWELVLEQRAREKGLARSLDVEEQKGSETVRPKADEGEEDA